MTVLLKFQDTVIELNNKPIKNVHLRVHPPDGRVTLSAPLNMDQEHLRVYVSTKLGWIRREQKKFIEQNREPEHEFITRESHYLFGKRYLLQITHSTERAKVLLHHSAIELVVPEGSTSDYKRSVLYKFYRKKLRDLVSVMIDKYADRIGVKPVKFGIHKVKTKWGSCNDGLSSLWFNIELAKKPKECVEYVVVHELIHLLERSHNKKFIMLMNRYMPNWQLRKKQLNELPI